MGSLLATALGLGACSGDPVSAPTPESPRADFHTQNVCDFVTFGRLIADGIVISGNAGGNAPGGGILGEIEIHVNGTTYHVHTITEYGIPDASDTFGPFAGDPDARVIVGTTDDGVEVHLRVIDNGEPGRNNDEVFLEIDGDVILGAQTIDQGNIQLHLNCRGPGD